MPRASEIYSGQYLSAADLAPQGKQFVAIIHSADVEEVGPEKDRKIVLELVSPRGQAWKKPAICNRTNTGYLSTQFGDEITLWVGKPVMIWAGMKSFQGKQVPGLEIRPGAPPSAPAAAALPPAPAAPGGTGVSYAPAPAAAHDLDDEIPF